MLSPHTPLHTSDYHLLDFLAQCGKVGSALLGIPAMQEEDQQEGDKQKVFALRWGRQYLHHSGVEMRVVYYDQVGGDIR